MRLLDLFCGAGGAAMGYHQAGFDEIVGVDIEPQPEYPFMFVEQDVLEVLEQQALYGFVEPGFSVFQQFDLVHASPPCQDYTPMSNRWGSDQPRLIPAVREALERSGTPYVIENVLGAAGDMISPITLTGEMFGLRTHRPRLFELGGWYTFQPPKLPRQPDPIAIYGKPDGRWLWKRNDGTHLHAWSSLDEGQEVLEVPWITDWHGVREAIPPAYTKFIGEQFLAQRGAA